MKVALAAVLAAAAIIGLMVGFKVDDESFKRVPHACWVERHAEVIEGDVSLRPDGAPFVDCAKAVQIQVDLDAINR